MAVRERAIIPGPPERVTPDEDAVACPEGPQPKRWTRAEFYRLAEVGLLPPDARVELIGGEIFEMSPMDPPHANSVRRVRRALERVFGDGYLVSEQLPLDLGGLSEPYPDLAVSEGSLDDYDSQHPQTAVLVVEVSDSTLRSDQGRKASLYARAGIPEYWIVNVVNRCLEVRRDPVPAPEQPFGCRYDTLAVYSPGQAVTPLTAPEASIAVDDLLPRLKEQKP